jgi:signal transduction histidine kinase
MKIDFRPVGPELTSSRWLDTLARTPEALLEGARGMVDLDLSSISWISHLPLLALCLSVQELVDARFEEKRVTMPDNQAVQAFLDRWRFHRFVGSHEFHIDAKPLTTPLSEAGIGSTVLEIQEVKSAADAEALRDTFRKRDTQLRHLLTNDSFLSEHDIHGLADLIVYELCENAGEHAQTPRPAIIFGHVSRDEDPTRSVSVRGAGSWEKPFFTSIRGEGMTEIVVGDSGVGIISSLREQAALEKITGEADVLRWAFEPFSTRKRDGAAHTRGLWAVKNKVRDLRGILYVRSGVIRDARAVGGWSAAWDFFNDPSGDKPTMVEDKVPFGGTQVQIMLPHRMSRYTFIEYHRPVLAGTARQLETREMLIPAEPPVLNLYEEIAKLPDQTVLFIDMSQIDDAGWQRAEVDNVGRQIFDGLRRQISRVWLLNPSDKILQYLQASSWVVDLWRQQGVLLPYARIGDADTPPRVSFVVKEPTIRSSDRGDTPAARVRLVELISDSVEGAENIRVEKLDDLRADERSWVVNALGTNHSLINPLRDERGSFAAALDIETLGRRAVSSLLGRTIHATIAEKIKAQREGPKMWYRLPSQVYCREYIDPRIFVELTPATRDALERWIEEKVARTNATHAVSYTTFATEMLTRAKRAGAIRTLEPLRHYAPDYVREQLRVITPGSRVVLLAAISGSGKTLTDTIRILKARNIRTSVVTIIDTTTPAERQTILDVLESPADFHYRTRWEIEKHRAVPVDESHIPIAVVDPETLVPLVQAPEVPTRLTDGQFWKLLSESDGVSVGAITYKGIDYTTMILLKNVLKHPDVGDLLIEDFRTCFHKEPGRPAPDIICCPKETMKVLSMELMRRLKRAFPDAAFVTEDRLERLSAQPRSKKKLEGQYVVVFTAAATSGAGVARLQRHFHTAKRMHLSVFINRISDGLMLALTGTGLRVSLTSFQRLVSGSPDLRVGSSRSIALPALQDYRASCLSNRLLLYVDKLRRDWSEPARVAQSPDELETVARPEPPSTLQFDEGATYRFGTAEGLESLQRLVRQCTQRDQQWLYGILDEVASRAEAALRNFQRDSREWQRAYVEDMARLYREAPDGPDVSARKTILEALLLHRWRWSESREPTDVEKDTATDEEVPPETRDELATAFAREMLGHMWRADDPDFRAVVVRSISKIDRELLLEELEEIIEICRHHRTTELTLALELTKVLDDAAVGDRLLARLTGIVREQARKRPAGRDDPFDVALEDLLADIGLTIFEGDGLPVVDFMRWPQVKAILADEPPDHDRTIRLLIRAMRGRLGPHARFLYYREETPGHYTYGDAWPRRSVTDKSRIREANIRAIALLGDRDDFFAPQLGGSKATEAYLATLARVDQKKMRKWGMALFRMQLGDRLGLIRVWQNVEVYGPLRVEDAEFMKGAIQDVEWLITRPPSAVRVIGEWQYEEMIRSLATRSSDYDPVVHFAEVVRQLLGGDACSLLSLDDSGKEWTRAYLGGRARALPMKFPTNDPLRLTNHVARDPFRGRVFHDITAARDAGFLQRPAVDWAEAWLALPLVHPGSDRCRAVLHIWHHIPGWFDDFVDSKTLMPALQSLGGTVVELNAAHKMADMVRDASLGGAILELEAAYKLPPIHVEGHAEEAVVAPATKPRQLLVFDRDEIDRLGGRLVNLTLASEGLLSMAGEHGMGRETVDTLRRSVQQTQENLAQLLRSVQVPETEPVPVSLEKIVRRVVDAANQTYGETLVAFNVHEHLSPLYLRDRMMSRAIEELLKNAKAHLQPGEKVRVDLTRDEQFVVLTVQNAGYGIPRERKETVFGMGSGLVLAKAAVEKHGGRLEEVGEPGEAAVFRIVLPAQMT